MKVFTTNEGGDMARFGVPTGNTRERDMAAMFGGCGTRVEIEIEAFEILHPDLTTEGMAAYAVPEWISSRPCGAGKSLGKEWA
jgi:hypothetical protein